MNRASLAAKILVSVFLAIVIAGVTAVLVVYRHTAAGKNTLPAAQSVPTPQSAPLPLTRKYLGVFEPGAPYTYTPIDTFAQGAAGQPGIVVYYSRWGAPFQARFATAALQHGATVLVQIEPGQRMSDIANGAADTYLRSYAGAVRSYGHPVIISFAPEGDGPWYQWGYSHTRPQAWVAAWRHVVTLFRRAGAVNVTWLWDMSERTPATTSVSRYWPGSQYVTWVGLDGYYIRPADTFATVFAPTIAEVRRLTQAPILIAETAVGTTPDRLQQIRDLAAGVRVSHLLGLVWFDQSQHQPPYHQDWRLEDDPAALAAFRSAVSSYAR